MVKKNKLEDRLRELFNQSFLYTIDDIVRLSGYPKSYVRTKISNLQNSRYTDDPLTIVWVRCEDNIKRVGSDSSNTIFERGTV